MGVQPSLFWKLLDWNFYLLQKLQITQLYEFLSRKLKPHRPLNRNERLLARFVYGDSIDLDKVRIDEQAYLGPKQYRLCYVSFNTINSWGRMSDAIFIHELIHIWQYQHFGAAYIPRALWAQRTPDGYNYGGVEALKKAIEIDKKLWEFNYEQQGDIIADYFRISHGQLPCWGNATEKDLDVYEHFVMQLQEVR